MSTNTYCYICNQQIVGAILSDNCDCGVTYCRSCWKNFFISTYTPVNFPLYIKKEDGSFIEYKKLVFEEDDRVQYACPECDAIYEEYVYINE